MIVLAPETAIIFGSVARGDYDAMSDKDILVIDHNRDNLRSAAATLEQKGWSVAQFTWTQMAVLKARQSLFLYHIVREGVVLRDKEHRYSDLISKFEPASCYADEIQTSKHILDVVRTIPRSDIGRLWAADVMAVAARNMGVALLAQHGIYKFSLPEICGALRACDLIDEGESRMLSNLRKLKYYYRHGEIGNRVTFSYLKRTSQILDRLLSLGWTVEEQNGEKILGDSPKLVHPYAFSRSIEKRLHMLRPNGLNEELEFNFRLANLRKIATDPRRYVWRFKRAYRASVEGQIRQLERICIPRT